MPPWRSFLFGLLGSAAVEIARAVATYEANDPFPAYYRKPGFWIVRAVLAAIGGGLAVAYAVQSDILAFHVGATTPAIIETFLRRLPVNETPDVVESKRPKGPGKPRGT